MKITLALNADTWKTRFIIASAGIVILWVWHDFAFIGREKLSWGHPLLSPFYILRSIAIAGSAFLLVLCPVHYGHNPGTSLPNRQDQLTLSLGQFGSVRLPGWLLPTASFLAASAFFILFLTQPRLFSYLAREDKIIEVLSALLLFLSSGIFVLLLVRSCARPLRHNRFFNLALLLFAVVFMLIGMEEVSWFQRSLGFETPGAFDGNLQGEFNLHNFATDDVELAYYFFSFVFLIFLPFLHDQTDMFDSYPGLAYLIPGRMVLFSSALFVAYTYDTWNNSLDQLAFFSTFFILSYYVYKSATGSGRRAGSPVLPAILVTALVVFQVGYITFGEHFVVNWDVTEYKELFIPLGFWIYALNMSAKETRIITPRVVWICASITLLMFALRLVQKYRV